MDSWVVYVKGALHLVNGSCGVVVLIFHVHRFYYGFVIVIILILMFN
jgi:hypothetical protein